MKPKQYHHISTIVSEGASFLATLQQKAALLATIKRILLHELPRDLSAQLHIKNTHQGIIELSVTTSAIATSIRHQAPSLLKKINMALARPLFFQLLCQVNPKKAPEERAVQQRKQAIIPISEQTKAKLAKLSTSISCPALAQALEKLATGNTKNA